MFNTCESLKEYLSTFSLVQQCDLIKNDMLRIQTPFQYMDGSKIDLFIGEKIDLFGKNIIISDLGQTVATLLEVQFKPWSNKKRKEVVNEICSSLNVQWVGGEFKVELKEEDLHQVSDAIVRLSQACIRIADMALNQRIRNVLVFKDEIEESFTNFDLDYETGFPLMGRFDRAIELDFKVQGTDVVSLIQVFPATSRGNSHNTGTNIFQKWYDIGAYKQNYQFITILESKSEAYYRPDDIQRIEDYSTTLYYPAQEEEIISSLVA